MKIGYCSETGNLANIEKKRQVDYYSYRVEIDVVKAVNQGLPIVYDRTLKPLRPEKALPSVLLAGRPLLDLLSIFVKLRPSRNEAFWMEHSAISVQYSA